jgi:hypothetical protein
VSYHGPSEREKIADQINAATIFAGSDFVNVHANVQRFAASPLQKQSSTHGKQAVIVRFSI